MRDGRIAGNADKVAFVKWRFEVRSDDFRMLTRASGSGIYIGLEFQGLDLVCQHTNLVCSFLKIRLEFRQSVDLDINICNGW